MTGSGNAWTALATGAGFVGWTAAWKLGLLAGLDALTPPSADAAGHAWAVAVAVVLRPLWVYVALGAWCLWWWFRGRRSEALALGLGILLGAVAESGLKALFGRPRPVRRFPDALADGWAYPSGHCLGIALAATLIVGLATPKARRIAGPVLGGLVVLVMWDRWFMAAHWPSDTVAGVLAGCCTAAAALALAPLVWFSPRG